VTYRAAIAATLRAAEVLAEAAAEVRGLDGPEQLADAELLDRITRRLDNAAARAELDARLIGDVLTRQREVTP